MQIESTREKGSRGSEREREGERERERKRERKRERESSLVAQVELVCLRGFTISG